MEDKLLTAADLFARPTGAASISPGLQKMECSPNSSLHPELEWDRVPGELRELILGLVNGKEPWPLFLYGRQGAGKTVVCKLLCSVVHGAILRQASMYDGIAFQDGGLDWEQAYAARLLIVDEVGARIKTANEFSYAAIKRILDRREHKHNRTGVYVSNLEPSEIASCYDDRIASRMMCGSIYCYDGKDQRMPKKENQNAQGI